MGTNWFNSMEHESCWETDSSSGGQDILCIFIRANKIAKSDY